MCPEYENEVPMLEKGSVKEEAGQGNLGWGARYKLEHRVKTLFFVTPCSSDSY